MDICIWVFASYHKLYLKDYPGGFWVSWYERFTISEPWMTVSCWWCPLKYSWTVFWPLKNSQKMEQFEQLVVAFSTLSVSRYTSRKMILCFLRVLENWQLSCQLSWWEVWWEVNSWSWKLDLESMYRSINQKASWSNFWTITESKKAALLSLIKPIFFFRSLCLISR